MCKIRSEVIRKEGEKLTNGSKQAWTRIGHETQRSRAVERRIQRMQISKDERIVTTMADRGQVGRRKAESHCALM